MLLGFLRFPSSKRSWTSLLFPLHFQSHFSIVQSLRWLPNSKPIAFVQTEHLPSKLPSVTFSKSSFHSQDFAILCDQMLFSSSLGSLSSLTSLSPFYTSFPHTCKYECIGVLLLYLVLCLFPIMAFCQ